jgi:ESCRT-I complex subunit VPS28
MQKLKLDPKARDHYDQLAELYSLILATEHLERQYIKGTVESKEYTKNSLLLISQYKTQTLLLKFTPQDTIDFVTEYKMNCEAALNRILIGVPSTIENPTELKSSTKLIAEIVQYFITLMDSIKLQIVDVDQIHPQLSDLIKALNMLNGAGEGKLKIKEWLIKLNGKKASDMLDEDESRQLLFDLESAYADFQYSLK